MRTHTAPPLNRRADAAATPFQRHACRALLGLLLGATGALPAAAAPITQTIDFSLSGFLDINSATPVPTITPSITGSFTVNFDPTLNYDNDTTDITVNSFAGTTVDSVLGFTYDAASQFLFFGGLQNDADYVVTGTNDFVLTLDMSNLANPAFVACNAPGISCGASTGDGTYAASGYTSTQSESALWFLSIPQSQVGTVPEPSAPAILATAFGLMLWARSGRRSGPGPKQQP